jgi:hypothetical protein
MRDLILTNQELSSIALIEEKDMQVGQIVASVTYRAFLQITDIHPTGTIVAEKISDLYLDPIKPKQVYIYGSEYCADSFKAAMRAKLQKYLINF